MTEFRNGAGDVRVRFEEPARPTGTKPSARCWASKWLRDQESRKRKLEERRAIAEAAADDDGERAQ